MTDMLQKFIAKIRAKDRRSSTIEGLERTLGKAQEWIGKPLENASYDEIERYIAYIKKNGNPSKDKHWKGREHALKNGSIELIQRRFLQFYNFCFNQTDDPKYHKIWRQIKEDKMSKPKNGIEAKDILSTEEAKKLINVATLERDKCIVAVLFESGMRIGELMALTNAMVQIIDKEQKVIFHIPNQEGCKTGARSVTCVEVHSYVQDWMKCNTSKEMFMPLTADGVRKIVERLYEKAGIKKPSHVHMLRHSAITFSASLKMSETELSMRYWGVPHSAMVSRYIHLSQQMLDSGYMNAKGMGDKDIKVINPLALRCVECGKLIESGNLCPICQKTKKLSEENAKIKNQIAEREKHFSDMIDDMRAEFMESLQKIPEKYEKDLAELMFKHKLLAEENEKLKAEKKH